MCDDSGGLVDLTNLRRVKGKGQEEEVMRF